MLLRLSFHMKVNCDFSVSIPLRLCLYVFLSLGGSTHGRIFFFIASEHEEGASSILPTSQRVIPPIRRVRFVDLPDLDNLADDITPGLVSPPRYARELPQPPSVGLICPPTPFFISILDAIADLPMVFSVS